MKHLLTTVSSIIMAAALLLTSGCYREIEERIDVVDQEIAGIDEKLDAMEDVIESLSSVYATIQNFDVLKEFAEVLRSDLDKLQNAYDVFVENAATVDQLNKVKALASSVNSALYELSQAVNADLDADREDIEKLKSAITKAEKSLENLSKLIYFISMEIIPEAVVNGSLAVLFTSNATSASFSVTLDVAPASRTSELIDHISFSIVPVTTFTRAADATIIEGETYTVNGNRITVTAPLPKKKPFYDPSAEIWDVDQAFAISAKYIDDDGLVQLSTPYVSAFLTSTGGSISKTVFMILGEKNDFWEAVAEGAKEAAGIEGEMAVDVTYCSSAEEQKAALNKVSEKSKKANGLIIYPINESIEESTTFLQEDLDIPVVVVGKELAKDSPLTDVCRTQVIMRDTTAIKKLSQHVLNDSHKSAIILCREGSEISKARAAAAELYLSGIQTKVLETSIEKAESNIIPILQFFKEYTAVLILDEEFLTSDILDCTKSVNTYAFGSVNGIKEGVAAGSIKTGIFKNGYPFGAKGFDALFNGTPSPCLIDPETVLSEE